MNINDILSKNENGSYNAIVEILKGTVGKKYEMDIETGEIKLDRIIPTELEYPGYYGFIPHIIAGDGDYVDVILLGESGTHKQSEVVKTKIIGVLKVEDQSGEDWKYIAVLEESIENDISGLQANEVDAIVNFYKNYKNNEEGKWSKVIGLENADFANKHLERLILEIG